VSRIIHTDNSEFFRKLMRTFLVELGHETNGLTKGEEALTIVKAGKADCVVTGLELADMGGEEYIKRLLGVPQAVPVIVVTSQDNAAQKKRLDALGVKAVIQKSGDWKSELSRHLADIHK
jgi:CheY-like chemotaxis protein